jgi:hypothetical protein
MRIELLCTEADQATECLDAGSLGNVISNQAGRQQGVASEPIRSGVVAKCLTHSTLELGARYHDDWPSTLQFLLVVLRRGGQLSLGHLLKPEQWVFSPPVMGEHVVRVPPTLYPAWGACCWRICVKNGAQRSASSMVTKDQDNRGVAIHWVALIMQMGSHRPGVSLGTGVEQLSPQRL